MTERSIIWRQLSQRWVLPVILLFCGAIARFAWVALRMRGKYASGEIANVAIAYSKTGTLANPFSMGPEPTAHVLPIPPIFAGLLYRAWGVHSTRAEVILEISSTLLVLGSFLFLYLIFDAAGMSRRARLSALAIACLVPFNFVLETIEFRIWEGALATFCAFGFVWLLTVFEVKPISTIVIVAMSILAALVFFISPPLGLACYTCFFIFTIRRMKPWRTVGTAVIAAIALGAVIAPWAIRNDIVLGAPVFLRSNFGLELALANHARALSSDNELQVFHDRLREIHPIDNPAAYAKLRAAGGEVPYAHQLGTAADKWIIAHPRSFAILCLHHLRQYFFPPAWFWNIYAPHGNASFQAWLHTLLSIAALVGLSAALVTSGKRYLLIAIMFFVPALPYVILQPVPRYRYIIFGISIFLGVDGLSRLITGFHSRRLISHPSDQN